MEKPNRFRSNIGQSHQYNPNTPKTGHTCWICGYAKHYARDCPQNMHNTPISGIKNRVGHNETTFKGGIKLTTKQVGNVRYVEDKNGKRFQLKEMAALASDQRKGIVVVVGQVSGRPDLVEVLRDSGCSTMVIRKDLCDPDDFTGETRGCVMMGGRVIEVPVVTKTVYTPYYTGIVEGVAMDSPVYDLVIGNLLGARNQEDPDTSWKPSELKKTTVNAEKTADIDIISDEITDHVITGGVVTRSQSKDKPLRPLKVAKTKISKRQLKGSSAAANSTSNVSEMTSLRLTNEILRRKNEMLIEKMKRCMVKAAEDVIKTKRMYENAVKELNQLKKANSRLERQVTNRERQVTRDDHISEIRQVLERLRRHGLTAKPSKCEIGHAELDLLGHIVGGGSIKSQDKKLEKILGTRRPETKKELRSFLGTIGYYQKFIDNYVNKAKPLTDRLKKVEPNQVS